MVTDEARTLLTNMLDKVSQIAADLEKLQQLDWPKKSSRMAGGEPAQIKLVHRGLREFAAKAAEVARDALELCAKLENADSRSGQRKRSSKRVIL